MVNGLFFITIKLAKIMPLFLFFDQIYINRKMITIGTADSIGDDNLELVDSEGNVVDFFGIIGEDGSDTNHEFEDGRALRNASIVEGNPGYTFIEWQIWNDTGGAGTTNVPQDATEAFNPGVR